MKPADICSFSRNLFIVIFVQVIHQYYLKLLAETKKKHSFALFLIHTLVHFFSHSINYITYYTDYIIIINLTIITNIFKSKSNLLWDCRII